MEKIQAFLHMGGFAVYVWTAYGMTLLILLFNYLMPLRALKRLQQQTAFPSNSDPQKNNSDMLLDGSGNS